MTSYVQPVRKYEGCELSPGRPERAKRDESHAFIVKKTPDGLSSGKRGFLRTGKIFNRTGKWISRSHMLFNPRLISAAEPGIKPDEDKGLIHANHFLCQILAILCRYLCSLTLPFFSITIFTYCIDK